jgi:hypothetical protein
VAPGEVTVRFGAPLAAAAYGLRRKAELMAEVRGEIARLAGLESAAAVEAEAVR